MAVRARVPVLARLFTCGLLFALAVCQKGLAIEDGRQAVEASTAEQLVAGLTSSTSELILVNSCMLSIAPSLWGQQPATIVRNVTLQPSPELKMCRPLINFNYAAGVLMLPADYRIVFRGVEIYKAEVGIPIGLIRAAASTASGHILLDNVVLHNEVSPPGIAVLNFFQSLDRPVSLPGIQHITALPVPWCMPENTTRCFPFAANASDIAMAAPVTPARVGGYILSWQNSFIIADDMVSEACLKVMPMTECIKNLLASKMASPPLAAPGADGILPASADDDQGSTAPAIVTWLAPVLVSVLVLVTALIGRWLWLAAHSPHELSGLLKINRTLEQGGCLAPRTSSNLNKQGQLNLLNKQTWLGSLGDTMQTVRRSLSLMLHPTPGGVSLGPLIGAGSFGRVYKGLWKGQKVAVKVLMHASDHASVANELELSMKLSHPNVVKTLFHARARTGQASFTYKNQSKAGPFPPTSPAAGEALNDSARSPTKSQQRLMHMSTLADSAAAFNSQSGRIRGRGSSDGGSQQLCLQELAAPGSTPRGVRSYNSMELPRSALVLMPLEEEEDQQHSDTPSTPTRTKAAAPPPPPSAAASLGTFAQVSKTEPAVPAAAAAKVAPVWAASAVDSPITITIHNADPSPVNNIIPASGTIAADSSAPKTPAVVIPTGGQISGGGFACTDGIELTFEGLGEVAPAEAGSVTVCDLGEGQRKDEVPARVSITATAGVVEQQVSVWRSGRAFATVPTAAASIAAAAAAAAAAITTPTGPAASASTRPSPVVATGTTASATIAYDISPVAFTPTTPTRGVSPGAVSQPVTPFPGGLATAGSSLDITHILDSGKSSETWICMELCDGGSLAMARSCGLYLMTTKPRAADTTDDDINCDLPPRADIMVVLEHARDVARGMAYLHSQGIIHGDLKCENVMLQRKPTAAPAATRPDANGSSSHSCYTDAVVELSLESVYDDAEEDGGHALGPRAYVAKVADFGLSRLLGAGRTHLSTHAMGTVTHCPPELLLKGMLRPAADVYAFGIMLYELGTGFKAFAGMSHGAVVQKVVVAHERPGLPPGHQLPDEYVALMQACWAHEPLERPSFTEVIDHIDALLFKVVPEHSKSLELVRLAQSLGAAAAAAAPRRSAS